MSIEVVDIVDRWLAATLNNDPTLTLLTGGRITSGDFPEEWANPLVTFDMSSTRDVVGVGGQRLLANCLYVVKVIDEASSYAGDVLAIATRIDELLGNVRATIDEGHVDCHREMAIRYSEVRAGIRYVHLGAMYRVWAST